MGDLFMRAIAIFAALLLAGCATEEAVQPKARPTVAGLDIKSQVVAASIYGYERTAHNCPCPYSKDGSCNGVSAWDRRGGAEPRCYKSEVTAKDMKHWRELQKPAPEHP
jgi:hypothetical protein